MKTLYLVQMNEAIGSNWLYLYSLRTMKLPHVITIKVVHLHDTANGICEKSQLCSCPMLR